ncbi:ABC transporter substrate-binding protein [Algoriphagus pacificus]|uniref:ABC transporter substrate-binding protein n=1 Tax=Algoriphagus pacificus TaxID=2811234 RepID=A0ABS3CMX5_9BACT|nr:ABC transporter substrate-binding protein [Algoriphagus pacificus]MBN7816999.1 ABC transporter substrate-binding protein [Algoriphagus pacificus]
MHLYTSILILFFFVYNGLIQLKNKEAVSKADQITFILPESNNLQWINFYVAVGAGFIDDSIQLKYPKNKRSFDELFDAEGPSITILPRPLLIEFASEGKEIKAIANLLENDPVNLIGNSTVVQDRQVDSSQTVAQILEKLQGLRIGVAPGPVTRLKKLLEFYGFDPENHFKISITGGRQQNAAFEKNEIDLLYAHTPFLEDALVNQNGNLLINQSNGSVPALSERAIHFLAVKSDQLEANQAQIQSVVSGIYRAQVLLKNDPEEAFRALMKSPVKYASEKELRTIFDIYKNAVPSTPLINPDFSKELDLLPGHSPVPSSKDINYENFIDNRFAQFAIDTL